VKIETHTHCKPVSVCAHHQPEEFPQMLKDAGIDACVLTNHCYPGHMRNLSDDLKEQAKIYVDVFERAKKAGEEIGFKVFLPADTVQSRSREHKEVSLRRMEAAGAVITNYESVLYEMLGSAKAPEFKAISAIVK
jgi:hypothetical protein